jgi:hypothetical protein
MENRCIPQPRIIRDRLNVRAAQHKAREQAQQTKQKMEQWKTDIEDRLRALELADAIPETNVGERGEAGEVDSAGHAVPGSVPESPGNS